MAPKESTEGTVLLDVTDVGYAAFAKDFLERTGHHALVCHGPNQGTCPLLAGAGCEKIDAAHGVVFQFDLDSPQHRAILLRYKKILHPEVPVRVVVESGQDRRYADLLEGTEVWTREPTAGDLDASLPKWRLPTNPGSQVSSSIERGSDGKGRNPQSAHLRR